MQNVEEEKSGIRTHYWIKPDRKNTSKPDAKSDILAIEENNISIKSPLMVAQYNSPWTMPPFRRNELMYEIN